MFTGQLKCSVMCLMRNYKIHNVIVHMVYHAKKKKQHSLHIYMYKLKFLISSRNKHGTYKDGRL